MEDQNNRIAAIDAPILTPLVRRALRRDAAEVTTWAADRIYGGLGFAAAIYRVSGDAQDAGERVPWSLILKITPRPEGRDDPSDARYWKREALVYRSGFLEGLRGGLASPRCYDVIERADEVWLWLEEIQDAHGGLWPLERYSAAARHLGHFNGERAAREPPPEARSWLSRGWLRAWVGSRAPIMARLDELLRHPAAARFYPPDVARAYRRLWDEQERFLDALDGLPQTLCHRDAFRRNLFARGGDPEPGQTVAIDWADAGVGAIGEDLAPLVIAGVLFHEIDLVDLPRLDRMAFAGYLSGLRDAGRSDHPKLARLGFTASAAMRYGLGSLQMLPILQDERQLAYVERALGRRIGEIADHGVNLHRFLLGLADEARAILDELPQEPGAASS